MQTTTAIAQTLQTIPNVDLKNMQASIMRLHVYRNDFKKVATALLPNTH